MKDKTNIICNFNIANKKDKNKNKHKSNKNKHKPKLTIDETDDSIWVDGFPDYDMP